VFKGAIACGLAVVVIAACGDNRPNPEAGSVPPTATKAGRAKIDDPRGTHLQCLADHHIPAVAIGANPPEIQIEPSATAPLIVFKATAGAAQAAQLEGRAQPAEVIGSALLYPRQGSDAELQTIEACLAIGVKG
jgi:hypothetical protein